MPEDPAKLERACARLEGWGGGTPLMLRDAALRAAPQHEGGEHVSMREESTSDGVGMAKRVHDRASGTSCKARVVAFSCFRPVPSCYRRRGEATKEAPAAHISAFDPVA